jgi:hypothetical protein
MPRIRVPHVAEVRRFIVAAIVPVAGAAWAVACSSASAGENVNQTIEALGTKGVVKIEVVMTPNPPVRGSNSARATIMSMDGVPEDGLTVTVRPWMPSMGHGTSVTPTVTPLGGGVYQLDDLDLFMPGRWELRMTLTGPVNDSAKPAMDVP